MKAKDVYNSYDKDKDKNKNKDSNKRLDKIQPTNKEGTAAWQNFEGYYKVDQVGKPSVEDVVEAKDWVDNGSKL
jgi:hypothetical protein